MLSEFNHYEGKTFLADRPESLDSLLTPEKKSLGLQLTGVLELIGAKKRTDPRRVAGVVVRGTGRCGRVMRYGQPSGRSTTTRLRPAFFAAYMA